MNLLLVELDGAISDCRRRLEEAQKAGFSCGAGSGAYWKQFYDPARMAEDDLVPGACEFVSYLATHKWRVVFLTTRTGIRTVYEATRDWLASHNFDTFLYRLDMRDVRYSKLSLAEWKFLKVRWYACEGEEHVMYRRIVLIEPINSIRATILQHWNARQSGQELETFANLRDFSEQITLGKERLVLDPLLQTQRTDTYQEDDIPAVNEEHQQIEEELVSDDPVPIVGRMVPRSAGAIHGRSSIQEEKQNRPLVEDELIPQIHDADEGLKGMQGTSLKEMVLPQLYDDDEVDDTVFEYEGDELEEDVAPVRRQISIVFPRSDEDPSTRRQPEKKQKHAGKQSRTYELAHLTLDT